MPLLQDKIAIVTGGASGIGWAAALAFAREGAKVVVADVNVSGGHEIIKLINDMGGNSLFVKTDVSSAAEVHALVDQTVKTYGRLDCAFNNAGIGGTVSPLIEKAEDEWDAVIGINLKGVWLCLKYEIPAMLAHGGGAIVNMASVAGLVGFRGGSITAPANTASSG